MQSTDTDLLGHWNGLVPNTNIHFGFIYKIEDIETGRKYIGKKNLFHSSGVVKSRVNNRLSPKWNKKHWKESDWKTYTGSSKPLNADIKAKGKDKFHFEILKLCYSKADLSYSEMEEQINRDVLRTKLDPDTFEYYNEGIYGVKFRPPEIGINIDHALHKFKHKDGREFVGKRYEFVEKFKLNGPSVCDLIRGERMNYGKLKKIKTHKGWSYDGFIQGDLF